MYIYNTCALSKHIGNMCMRLRNGGKARLRRAFSRVSRRIHIFTYMLRQCTCIVFIRIYLTICVILIHDISLSGVRYHMCHLNP